MRCSGSGIAGALLGDAPTLVLDGFIERTGHHGDSLGAWVTFANSPPKDGPFWKWPRICSMRLQPATGSPFSTGPDRRRHTDCRFRRRPPLTRRRVSGCDRRSLEIVPASVIRIGRAVAAERIQHRTTRPPVHRRPAGRGHIAVAVVAAVGRVRKHFGDIDRRRVVAGHHQLGLLILTFTVTVWCRAAAYTQSAAERGDARRPRRILLAIRRPSPPGDLLRWRGSDLRHPGDSGR